MNKKVVIIGGVAGGASCAARLRRLDENVEIVLLERGEYISYANCGLPYHVGGIIKSRESLLLQTPAAMKKKFNVDVRVKNEVVAINRDTMSVTVRRLETGETYEETYDTLVLSTGSSPVRPPIPGIDSAKVQTLWTVPDADRIRSLTQDEKVKSAAVIGGGFIGLEMAENLREAGLNVSLIEMLDQVMASLDFEMAQLLHENILENGVKLYLSDGVDSFHEEGEKVDIQLKSGKTVSADLVILSIGVRPNGELAKNAGLDMNKMGGIVTDAHMRTSDPHIYAVGDVIEVEDYIFKDKTMIPLAGPANREGRIAANNIAGFDEAYHGSQGTFVAKVFDLTVTATGSNEKSLIRRGLQKGIDYESVIITQNSHAGYYPGAKPMTLKLLFSMDGKKIYGAQIVGREGVDKRIDTIATTIRLNGSIYDLKELELAYAPPYSSAKDPVNMAGFVAENLLSGKVKLSSWDVMETEADVVVVDVREEGELLAFSIPGAIHIPLGQLRKRCHEINPTKKIVTLCAIGVRAYNGARILMQNGFEDVSVYPGGVRFYQSTHYNKELLTATEQATAAKSSPVDTHEPPVATIRIDCCGLQCPGPIMQVFETVKTMKDGEMLEILASDPGFARDIVAWCRRTGNTLVMNDCRDDNYVAVVKKGLTSKEDAPLVKDSAEGKTIIVFSGDLDKVIASFIIANGAAAMGRPVTMFFTFWGLTVLRKEAKQRIKKNFMEAMFGTMLPRGSRKLKLSRMNMAGMGTSMMKKIMNDKNVDSLEALIKKAMAAGVKIVACTMSMDVMGIREEELIDGVELGGVGAYLGDAEESNVNLFI